MPRIGAQNSQTLFPRAGDEIHPALRNRGLVYETKEDGGEKTGTDGMPSPFLPLMKGLAPRLDGKQDDENDGEKSMVCKL